jgi:hypothetical protein
VRNDPRQQSEAAAQRGAVGVAANLSNGKVAQELGWQKIAAAGLRGLYLELVNSGFDHDAAVAMTVAAVPLFDFNKER